ncbi:fibroblast growth factor receptor 3 isoform X2 [Folsomia candida]|uniref:fibroblast growth factor receptor 3 isoform X2 n=1 Tax=Folsomia candida TaxID=158441 RepID=UPI0016053E57|nr:fibroblast growth factor receptor 3 isoform X2 [Folsomia candida]
MAWNMATFTINYYAVTIWWIICFHSLLLLPTFGTTMPRNVTNLGKYYYKYDILNNSSTRTTTISTLKLNPNENRVCAFMNVSHNSSYVIYDREEFSKGLDKIHSTADIYEEFYNINIEPGCEATICELVLLDPIARSRKCYDIRENFDFTKDALKAADPATNNYFVSTGCSCKVPQSECNATQCSNSLLVKDDECGKLYKETSCTECRHDATILKEHEWFIPTNGFWCQSIVIRNGCRLSIDSIDRNGKIISNFANYTGVSSNISLNYVRKPTPPKLTCVCDVEDIYASQQKTTLTIAFAVSTIVIFLIIINTFILRKCIRVRVERKITKDQFDNVIRRFRHGFSKDDSVGLKEDEQNEYVSPGHLNALQQPYQHKWEINRTRISLGEQIGVGEFGLVYLAELKDDQGGPGVQVAGKIPKLKSISCLNSVLEEIKMWSYIGVHKNVCKFIGACTKVIPQDLIIILEYCSENNLKHYLRKNKSTFLESSVPQNQSGVHYVTLGTGGYASIESLGNLPDSKILLDKFRQLITWAAQIASGMEYICSKQVVHIDLAARNVFLNASLECKIGDFGLSQRLFEVANYVRIGDEFQIPFRWMALESLTDLRFTTSSDIWSYGVTLFEIFSLGDDPYAKVLGLPDLIQILKSGKRLEKPTHCSNDIYQIMLQCWDASIAKRPDFTQLKLLFESM